MSTTLRIEEVCGTDRVFRKDGARLRSRVEECWRESTDLPVVIDFQNLRIASIAFFDESLGLLALEHDLATIKNRIKVVNITEPDRRLLNQIMQSRSQERSQASL